MMILYIPYKVADISYKCDFDCLLIYFKFIVNIFSFKFIILPQYSGGHSGRQVVKFRKKPGGQEIHELELDLQFSQGWEQGLQILSDTSPQNPIGHVSLQVLEDVRNLSDSQLEQFFSVPEQVLQEFWQVRQSPTEVSPLKNCLKCSVYKIFSYPKIQMDILLDMIQNKESNFCARSAVFII